MTLYYGARVDVPTRQVGLGPLVVALGLRWSDGRMRWALADVLLAIVAAVLAVWHWDLAEQGVTLVDKVPRILPHFDAPASDWKLVRELAPSAAAVGMLGLLEAIAMAKSIAAKTGQKLDINQQ